MRRRILLLLWVESWEVAVGEGLVIQRMSSGMVCRFRLEVGSSRFDIHANL